MTSPITATLVGGPTLRLTYAGLTFLTDPTFDRPGAFGPRGGVTLTKLVGPAIALDDLGPVDVVLLSHDQHADNLDDAGRTLLADVRLVLSTPDAAERIPGVVGLRPWESTDAGDVTVTAVPARHGPEGAEPLSGVVTGFVLEAPGNPTVYVSGDNASLDVVAAVARRFPAVDLAVLFVGGANVGRFGSEPVTLDALLASAAVDLLAPARVIPVHHTDWAHFVEPLSVLEERLADGGRSERLLVLQRGVPTEVSTALPVGA
ncbi:MBL fold metallo-hydrolase [Cellulomonas sp. URHD0024]|uniref:MBL fold metallo-hydrolase n=1 Tax=Cellulomonas sp. URHD0024 TaxID=1302620 RepID=UPI000408D9F1|nr:MBL fold metallo-hydrolase [Cellulomonas sp. URHD0024]